MIVLPSGEKNPHVRVLMVGGAGSLEVAPGKTVIDSGLIPEQYIAIPIAHKEALDVFKKNSTVNWTHFSPAGSIQPGERTGKFRLGGEQLVVGENGKSEISMITLSRCWMRWRSRGTNASASRSDIDLICRD